MRFPCWEQNILHKTNLWPVPVCAALLYLWSCCSAAFAEDEAPSPEEVPAFTLGEVVVEGEEETISKVATVDTVKKETIDLNTATNAADAMRSAPGVILTTGPKNEKTFSIRGFNQRYIPVFYDGIPIYIPYDGYVDLGKLPTGNIARISISKGISSVLYGFNTMGGVVNIISRKPEKRFEADFDAGWSEGSRWDANVNLGARLGKCYFMGSYGWADQDAFVLSEHHKRARNQRGHRRENSDIDNQNSASFKIGVEPADGHEYALGWNHVKSEWGLPPEEDTVGVRYWRFTEWEKDTYYFIGDTKITDRLQLTTRIYRDEYYNLLDSYDNDLYETQEAPYAFRSTYDDYSTGGSLVLRTTYLPRNTISTAFHYKEDVHREQDNFYCAWERFETKTYAWGIEDDIKLTARLSLVAGASYDKHVPKYANGGKLREDEDSFNPQAGLHYAATDNTVLHFSVGKKSRFPSLKELYSDLLGSNLANPDLKSERAVNYEAGLEQFLLGSSTLRLTLFYSDVKDFIVNREIKYKVNQYQNIGEARFKGLECSLESAWIKNNDFVINYTWLDAEDRSPDRTSNRLEYQPKHNLYISNLYVVNRYLSLFCSLALHSKKYYRDFDDYMNWNTIDGFCTVDMKLRGRITKHLTIEAGANNLFDEDYEYNHGFPRPGRTFFTIMRGKI